MANAKKKAAKRVPEIGKGQVLRVKALKDGYRRAGLAHTKAGVDHPAGALSTDQVAQIAADPNLQSSVVDASKSDAGAGK